MTDHISVHDWSYEAYDALSVGYADGDQAGMHRHRENANEVDSEHQGQASMNTQDGIETHHQGAGGNWLERSHRVRIAGKCKKKKL